MRYLVALIVGIGALFGINAFADLFSLPRPWNSLAMGATVGITMVVVLLIWEVVKPSNKDAAPAKLAMSEEERTQARAERRARLAAEAGVSLDGTDEAEETADGSVSESAAEDGTSPEADESSIEAEPAEAQSSDAEPDHAEPETLAPDEFNEEATGSSLENPPTGEPGVSVDSLEDAESETTDADRASGDDESADAEESSDDDESGEETVPGGPTPQG